MPALADVLKSDIIYSARGDGSLIIATLVPVDDADRDNGRWDLRLTDKEGHSLKDELLTVKGTLDSTMYRKLYSLEELKALAQDRGYVEWHAGYPSALSASQTPPTSSPSVGTAPNLPLRSRQRPISKEQSEEERRKETERIVQQSLTELAKAKPGDIQQITAAQLNIDSEYCQEALQQGKDSFHLAAKFAPWGIAFIAISTLLLMCFTFLVGGGKIQIGVAVINIINSLLVEGIPGIGFYMYAQASRQFGQFSERLDRRNRYLMANGIITTIEDEAIRQQALQDLVKRILQSSDVDIDILMKQKSASEAPKTLQ